MSDNDPRLDFTVAAILKKWPSKNNGRATDAIWPNPYSVMYGSLDECIKRFLEIPANARHLYEIHTTPQGELVTAVIPHERVNEIAKLKDGS